MDVWKCGKVNISQEIIADRSEIRFSPHFSHSVSLMTCSFLPQKGNMPNFVQRYEKNLKDTNRESRFWEKYGGKMQFLTGRGKTDGV